MYQHVIPYSQVFAPSAITSLGAAIASVAFNFIAEGVDGPSSTLSTCQPPILHISPPPALTFGLPGTATSTVSIVEDTTSILIILFSVVCTATVLAAASGMAGVQKILYGGSPGPWPTPPPGRNGGGGNLPQWGLGWDDEEEEEEEEEGEGDPAGEGPPPPPPDPPTKVEEPAKLPRRRFPLWLILLICMMITGAGMLLTNYLRCLVPRMKATDPDEIVPGPRVRIPTPPQCRRPFLTPQPPLPPPPPPSPSPMVGPFVPPPRRMITDAPRRGITPPLATLAVWSAAIHHLAAFYQWVVDLVYYVVNVLLSAADNVWQTTLGLPRGQVMDMIALGAILHIWSVIRSQAETVAEGMLEGDTLIAEVVRMKGAKDIPPSPWRDDAERPAVAPPRPAPAAPIVHTRHLQKRGKTPAARIPDVGDGVAHSDTKGEEQCAGPNSDKRQLPNATQPVTTTARARAGSPGSSRIENSRLPNHEPIRSGTSIGITSVFDMWQPALPGEEHSGQNSLDNASLDVQGREDNSHRDHLESVCGERNIESINIVGPEGDDRRAGSNTLGRRNTPTLSSNPSMNTERRVFVPVYDLYQAPTGPAHRPNNSIDGASLEVQGKRGHNSCETSFTEGVEIVHPPSCSSPPQILPRRSSPTRRAIYDLYQPLTSPPLPPQDSIDGASLEVQGREIWDSRDMSSTEAVDTLPPSQPLLRRDLPLRPPPEGRTNQSADGRAIHQEEQRDPGTSRGHREQVSAGHAPTRISSVTVPPPVSGIPRVRRSLPLTAPVAPPPPARTPPDEKHVGVLPQTRAPFHQQRSRRASTADRAEQDSNNPTGRRVQRQGLGTAIGSGGRVAGGALERATPVIRPPSLPVGSGIPRASYTVRRPLVTAPSTAPPTRAQSLPTHIPTEPVTRRRDPIKPIAVSSPRRTNVLADDSSVIWGSNSEPSIPVVGTNMVFSEPSLPLSDGSFDNVALLDGTLPSTDSDSTVEHGHPVPALVPVVPSSPLSNAPFAVAEWEHRLLDLSLPASVEESSDVWAPTEDMEARRRLRENRPALRLVTASGFSLTVDVDSVEF